jgi:hypothetical protein
MALAVTLVFVFQVNTDAAAIRHASIMPSVGLRASWLAQHSARNQQLWAQRSGRRGTGISAANLNSGPVNLQEVWAAYKNSMRYSSQLKPASTTGFLPNTPFVNGLWNRRTINAARFDANHGSIAQMMDWDTYFKNTPSPAITPATNGPRVFPPANPQVIVPEPSSVMIGLSMIGMAFWARRKSAQARLKI